MRYTKLGNSDLSVSRICLGCMDALVGVMAQNTASAAKQAHVWSTGNQQIK